VLTAGVCVEGGYTGECAGLATESAAALVAELASEARSGES
jgi:hypothetical protein